MNRRINAAGLALVKQWEGQKTKAYRDVAGIWTIGYGHTSAAGTPVVTPNMVITEAEAEAMLRADLATFEERVSRLVKVPLTDNQFAVLVSFDFNTGRLGKSTLLKKLNAGDYDAVPAGPMKWVNAGGKRMKGLVNRRLAEAGLWAKGEFVSSNTVPAAPKVPEVVTKENVSWAAGIASTIGFAFTGNGRCNGRLRRSSSLPLRSALIRNRLDPARSLGKLLSGVLVLAAITWTVLEIREDGARSVTNSIERQNNAAAHSAGDARSDYDTCPDGLRRVVGTDLVGARGATPADQRKIERTVVGLCAGDVWTHAECVRHGEGR